MSAKYILMDRKITEAQKEDNKLQMIKWILLFISLPTVILIPVGLIIFFVCGSKQKKLKRVVADLEVAMAAS